MTDRLATVDPLFNDAKSWGAKGAAGDALARCENDRPFLAVWIDENGNVQWSKANTDFGSLAMLAAVVQEMAQVCIRDKL